jgi:hypothetical protein
VGHGFCLVPSAVLALPLPVVELPAPTVEELWAHCQRGRGHHRNNRRG